MKRIEILEEAASVLTVDTDNQSHIVQSEKKVVYITRQDTIIVIDTLKRKKK